MSGRILIVEDDSELAGFLRDFLQKKNYEVSLAENGLEAIEASHRHHIDLILMDVCMPFFSGLWFCKAFKDKPQTRNIPIVFVSGAAGEDSVQKAHELGAADFLKKPFDFAHLLAVIEKHILRHA
ncbi:MAG TPA: response regulator [Candidatus Eisenbacteria bacterium]|nr:response regulator [Candidatus Eisenbacteria bacterium]